MATLALENSLHKDNKGKKIAYIYTIKMKYIKFVRGLEINI